MENQLTVIENVSSIKELTLNAIKDNQNSVEKALKYGDNLYIQASSNMSDEMDDRIKKYIGCINATVKQMAERRKPATQLFDKIRQGFTSLENAISPKDENTIVGKLQKLRDNYALEKIRIAKEAEEKAIRAQLRLAEIERYKQSYKEAIHSALSKSLDFEISEINKSFSSITLENIDKKKVELSSFLTLPFDKKDIVPPEHSKLMTEEEMKYVAKSVYVEEFKKCSDQFNSEIKELVDDLILKIPSKRAELEKAESDKENAEKIRKDMELRDKEEAARRELQRKAEEEKQKQADALSGDRASIENVFETAALAAPGTKAKITKKIEVLDKKGFLNIIQMWWMGEGINMGIEELEKKLKFAVTYANKQAAKDNVIESPYISYKDEIKAK